ncbi:MAG: UbiD family decarboxylase [Gammaproteobacteria bacterium]|nr:UbiD family decarboxylase [Gammaproteobacteria bacterium]
MSRPDKDLRGFLETNRDAVTVIRKSVSLDDIGALSAQSERPIMFDNIAGYPDFRLCDILVKHRWLQARALGVTEEEYLPTLARRLRMPPRGFVMVDSGPVKEVKLIGDAADLMKLPVPFHTDIEKYPYITAMNIVKDPETGFTNSSHAGTNPVGPRRGLTSFITPHTQIIMAKHRRAGHKTMPIALCFGLHPAFEIMGNFSGLHMDMWGEMEMVGTIMDMDVEMVACETVDLAAPAHAEIIVEAEVNLEDVFDEEEIIAPTMYALPKKQKLPELIVTAITMRADRPIYRNHQVVPDTDHQVLPRLCHEAVLYNRLSEMGLRVHDVRFPTWGAAVSCIIQIEYPRRGFVNDALMQCMGAPWLNTKMVVAVSPDTDVNNPAEVYMAIATRADPARDMFIVPNTRCNFGDPSGAPVEDAYPHRTVGKIGIDATRKPGRPPADYNRAWPKNWGKVNLADYL